MDAGREDRVKKAVAGPASSPAPVTFLHYDVQALIGEGATAQVYRAVDRKLNRPVALKFLKGELEVHAQSRKRFLREAQAAARVVHPNVVGVHAAGEADGRLYLAMELVEGLPLNELLEKEKPGLKAKVTLLERAARGVAAAHAAGIVHRDLKPGNIMVTREGEPKVADFGLAHLVGDQTKLTRTGAAVGTPLYMAPEQVSGRQGSIGPQTDVYALGAILYEMLAGKPPHRGMNVTEVYARIVSTDPEAPRKTNPGVPSELEAVCMKALEKEGRRRYENAAAFAEDLARWLSGEPVQAKRTSRAYRLYRRVKRNPLIAGLAGAVVVAVLVAAIFWSMGRQKERLLGEEQRAALDMMRSTARVAVEAALDMRRAGLNGGMRKFLPDLEAAYRQAVQRAPNLAEVDYLMGRMHRALMDDAKALEFQDRALRKEPGHADARYERGLLHIRRYDATVESLRLAWRQLQGERTAGQRGRALAEEPPRLSLEDDEARALRRKATEDLEGSRGPVARALLSWLGGRLAEARVLFERAAQETPGLEEPFEWLARLAREAKDFQAAEKWYGAGLERDKGYLPLRRGRALARSEEAIRRFKSGGDARRALQDALSDCDAILAAEGSTAEDFNRRAAIRLNLGHDAEARGEDPFDHWKRAVADCDSSLVLDSERVNTWLARANIRTTWAIRLNDRLEDSSEFCRAAVADLGEAMRRAPDNASALWRRAWARMTWGNGCAVRKEELEPLLVAAIADADRAIQLDPSDAVAWVTRATLRSNLGNLAASRGEDPATQYTEALRDLEESIRLDPQDDQAWRMRGVVRRNWGYDREGNGESPIELYDAALADFEGAALRNPHRAELHLDWGEVLLRRSSCARHLGADPVSYLDSAISHFSEAIRLNPKLDGAWTERSRAHGERGNVCIAAGLDPVPWYEKSIRDADEAIGLNPRIPGHWRSRGFTRLAWLGYLVRKKGQAGSAKSLELYAALREDIGKAIELDPEHSDGFLRRGLAHEMMKAWRDAISDFEEAARLKPAIAAEMRQRIARARAQLGE